LLLTLRQFAVLDEDSTMRVLKPEWVGNDERPIFSIDIHPDGSRFATGGQGDNCGKVSYIVKLKH
jgi:hypothetical protein